MGRYGNTAIATLYHRHSRRYGSIAITPLWTPLLLSPCTSTRFSGPRSMRRRQPVFASPTRSLHSLAASVIETRAPAQLQG